MTPLDRKQCEEDVRGPGKFQGQAAYVPYYYDMLLQGAADEDNGDVASFKVTPEDKAIFPELGRRRVVRISQDDNGFVTEV